jgi:hypothetical protein
VSCAAEENPANETVRASRRVFRRVYGERTRNLAAHFTYIRSRMDIGAYGGDIPAMSDNKYYVN